jgi:Tol biopolymer transport system component/DNA-binding winged helix-turn-helix (wHTH) protein
VTNQIQTIYEFGVFRVDARSRRIFRDGEVLPLTPKCFEILLMLLENNGEIVKKEDLMSRLWPDSFVEEGNLTYNISVLRKALGERTGEHRYIVTVPGRGYRFVASVIETQHSIVASVAEPQSVRDGKSFAIATQPDASQEAIARSPIPTSEHEATATIPFKQQKIGASLAITALVVAAAAAISFGVYIFSKPRRGGVPFANIAVTKLTTFNDARRPCISSDGKYVVYVKEAFTAGAFVGKFSLWLRAVGTTSEVQVVPETEGDFYNVTFSPDGKYLYYSARLTNQPPMTFRIPLLGGNPTKIPLRMQQVSISPDGEHLAFWRSLPDDDKTSIVISNADGTDEREIVSRQAPNYFWPGRKLSWSPDGKIIACVAQNGNESFPRVFEINVEDRTERPVTAQKWSNMGDVVWLPDMSGLLLIAAEETSCVPQIWRISYPSGEAHRVTNDTVNYSGLDLTADGKTLVTASVEGPTSIWVMPVETTQSASADRGTFSVNASNAKQINVTNLTGTAAFEYNDARLSWTPDGRIVYMSEESGNADIWSMNSDGSDRKQLTTDPHWDAAAVVSPDGRYIAFMSNRTGQENIWIMDIDGANQRRLTKKFIERVPVFTADSKWVFFHSWETGTETIWKVAVEGSEPTQVVTVLSDLQDISSDGSLLAYLGVGELSAMKLFIAPSTGGSPIKSFDLYGYEYYWSPNNRSLTFRWDRNGVTNLWEQPLDSNEPRQLTYFTSDGILTHAWSRDGKQLAVGRYNLISNVVLINDLK